MLFLQRNFRATIQARVQTSMLSSRNWDVKLYEQFSPPSRPNFSWILSSSPASFHVELSKFSKHDRALNFYSTIEPSGLHGFVCTVALLSKLSPVFSSVFVGQSFFNLAAPFNFCLLLCTIFYSSVFTPVLQNFSRRKLFMHRKRKVTDETFVWKQQRHNGWLIFMPE